jgi:cytochrome c biogenesis protein CcdA
VSDRHPKNLNIDLPPDVGLGLDRRGKLAAIASFALPAILVVGVLFLMVALRQGAESALAQLASLLPVGYAFSAGMVASVNPCGFLLLPSYILYHLGTGEDDFYQQAVGTRLLKALYLGAVATLGFVIVFGLTGSVVAGGGRWLNAVFPYARAVIGVAMAALGVWLLVTRKTFGLKAASRVTITPKRNVGNVFLFGIVYAIGSLSCTLPIFLVVVGSALTSQAWGSALGQFIGYALGMASVFVAVTLGAALIRHAATRRLQGIVLYVNRFSALLLVGVGGYLVYDWIVQIYAMV